MFPDVLKGNDTGYLRPYVPGYFEIPADTGLVIINVTVNATEVNYVTLMTRDNITLLYTVDLISLTNPDVTTKKVRLNGISVKRFTNTD